MHEWMGYGAHMHIAFIYGILSRFIQCIYIYMEYS